MFALVLAAVTAAAQLAPVPSADRLALEQLKDANDAAWNRRDAATIVAQYVADASVRVAPDADIVVGQAEIGRFFSAAFARRQGEFRHVTTMAHIEPLDPRTMLAEANVRVERQESSGNWSLVRRFRTITIAVRDGRSWKLRSVRAIPLS